MSGIGFITPLDGKRRRPSQDIEIVGGRERWLSQGRVRVLRTSPKQKKKSGRCRISDCRSAHPCGRVAGVVTSKNGLTASLKLGFEPHPRATNVARTDRVSNTTSSAEPAFAATVVSRTRGDPRTMAGKHCPRTAQEMSPSMYLLCNHREGSAQADRRAIGRGPISHARSHVM